MQDFDTLRHRVEETAERLSLAQSERQEETQSLISILHDLEEKYSAQEKQFAYYRARLEPLERSNTQLTSLVENLLDLIDRGFGESSLDPLRKASQMASTMLEKDITPLEPVSADNVNQSDTQVTGAMAETDPEASSDIDAEPGAPVSDTEPEMATLDDIGDDETIEAVAVIEDDAQVIQDLVELVDESPEIAGSEPVDIENNDEAPVASEDAFADEQDDAQYGEVADLELEEVPLSYLEEDIDAASDIVGTDIDAIAAIDLADPIAAGEDAPLSTVAEDMIPPPTAIADDVEQSPVDMMSDDASPEDLEAGPTALFEDVTDAVLTLELEEDASAGFEDLPEIVKTAAAAFASGDTADEADSIAALAQAMEEETKAEHAAPPAPSDIRSLMLRVEALAKKAEAMRLAQNDIMETSQDSEEASIETETDTHTDDKNSGVAA